MPFKLMVDGHETDAIMSVYTLALYEQEFQGADLIKDIFGKVEVTEGEIAAAMEGGPGEGVGEDRGGQDGAVVVIDYGKTNWTALTRCAWACLKAANDRVRPFSEWSREGHDLNLFDAAGEIFPEANRAFFRAGADPSE